MDGVVIIERETGALHFSKSFSHRFDVRHPKSDRMNLGALVFAFQNFAGNSFIERVANTKHTSTQPDILLFETSTERIVLAQCSRKHNLLIVLCVHPLVNADTAKSFVHRIAYNYDHNDNANSGLAAALNQNARLFRDATEQALNDEVDHLLQQFFLLVQPTATTEFMLFHYSPPLINSSRRATPSSQYDDYDDDLFDDDDTGGDDRDAVRCASVVFMSPTTVAPTHELPNGRSASPSHGTVGATDSLLASLKLSSVHSHNDKKWRKHNKNAVVDHAGPKRYQRLVTTTEMTSSSTVTELYPPPFTRALVDKVEPFVNSVMPMMNHSRDRHERSLCEITWRRCPLPLSSSSSADLCIWKRNKCLLIYPQGNYESNTIKGTVHTLFDSLEALARFSFKLQT